MLSKESDTLINSFLSLGLTKEEIDIFLYINKNGSSTPLNISKYFSINRTRVYRIMDKLVSLKLLVQVLGDRGVRFEIPDNLNLDLLLAQKESELDSLRESMFYIKKEIQDNSFVSKHKSSVKYYHGISGLEQVTWNSTKAKGTLRIYEVSNTMDAFLSNKFSEKVRQEFVDNKVHIKQLTNLTKFEDFTKVTELVTKYWECRNIDKKKLDIEFEILIYNDVVTLYTYKNNDIFCIEIRNPYLASMQSQLFDFVWNESKPLKILSSMGKASI